MKKVLTYILLVLLLGGVVGGIILFATHKPSDDHASAVRNNIYYATRVKKDQKDLSNEYVDKQFRIIFMTDHFKVVIGNDTEPSYGYYLGTYETDKDLILLNATEFGGALLSANVIESKKDFYFEKLYYKNGKIHLEFINNGSILQYQFEKIK